MDKRKGVRLIPSGSDPEQFAITPDRKKLFISNEDTAAVSILDIRGG
jgi:hypothetical protein